MCVPVVQRVYYAEVPHRGTRFQQNFDTQCNRINRSLMHILNNAGVRDGLNGIRFLDHYLPDMVHFNASGTKKNCFHEVGRFIRPLQLNA